MGVAVITGFVGVDDTIAAKRRCAKDRAIVLVVDVAVVASLKLRRVLEQISSTNPITAARHLAAVRARVSVVDVPIITDFVALLT